MDVIGNLGYVGQRIRFIDNERFAFDTGNALCIYDTTKGPRELYWRMSDGVHCFTSSLESQLIAYAPAGEYSKDVEIVNSLDHSSRCVLLNPCGARVVAMCFSREGDKLFAITDTTDHQLIVWAVGSASLLAQCKIDVNCTTCECNPCNSNQVCLYGDLGVLVGTLHEVLGVFAIKMEGGSDGWTSAGEAPSVLSPTCFVLWIPGNRVITADANGNVFELRVEKKSMRSLGHFSVPDKRGSRTPLHPTHAVLTVANVVVVTEQGHVYWYPVLNLMGLGEEEGIFEMQFPVQMCNMHGPVSSLALDQNFLTLLAGTYDGAIFKVPVEVVETDFGKTEPDPDQGAGEVKAFKPVDTVDPVHLGNDPHHGGVTLCASHLTIEVQKFSARSRSSLSLFLTGSHLGTLQFWRYSSQVVENMTANGGIRRSAPRALRSVFQLSLGGEVSAGGALQAVCSLEFVTLPLKHARLLLIGTEDGCVEVWTLEAQENEDEDARDSSSSEDKGGNCLRLLEDDEGSCLVRLEARRIFQTKLFSGPVTLLCSFPVATSQDQTTVKFAVGSSEDCRVYFFNAFKDDFIAVQKSVDGFVTLESSVSVRSMAWTDDLLHMFCASGEVLLYETKDSDVPRLKLKAGTGLPVVSDGSFTATVTGAVLLTNSTELRICPLNSLHDERIGVEFRVYEHNDIVVIVAHAPNGRLFASGCVDGSVYLWRLEPDSDEVAEVNRIKPHAGAVTSLVFSSDSSLLMSCGVDGSCFLLTLDKPSGKGGNRVGSIKASFSQEDGPQYIAELIPEKSANAVDRDAPGRGNTTWFEQREAEKAKDLRSRHKFKAMGIGAAVNEIAQRLRVLVTQNSERSELEVLDRSEFVIDVKRRDAVEFGNVEKANMTRRLYAQRNFCNEVRAARIRTKCWDQQDVKTSLVLPLVASSDSPLCQGVSSFPVQKYPIEHLSVLNKVKRLRAMEVRAQRADEQGSVTRLPGTAYYRSAWATALAGSPQVVTWISNDGTRWPVSDKVAGLLAADKVSDASAAAPGKDKGPDAAVDGDDDDGSLDEEDHVLDESNVLNLLYPPQAVRSQVQKRAQIVLLREIVRQIRVKFNDQFEKLRREKADIIGSIDSRNTRMRAILEDLHQGEDLFSPTNSNKEVLGSTICVDASELRTAPYESEANRQIRLREEEERRQRELAKDKEDAKGRALEEMMHGTLEVKRDVFAEASAFVKPEWMDTLTTADMNEAQLREYDAYMTKLKALQEEQATYRKALEQEMKRLKNEVTDLCKVFDDKLAELASLKVLVHREIFSHEIYIARLALNMARTEQTTKFLRKSEEQVLLLRSDRADVRRSMEALGVQLEDMKSRISAIQEEERQMDKTFRRDLQNLCNNTFDQDALKVLTSLYRQRTYPRGGEAAMENYGDQSEADASASASKTHRRSKDNSARGGKNSKSQSKRGGGGLNSSSTNDVNKNKKMKASKGGASAGGGGKDANLGPMQQAAQALRTSDEPSYKDKDPYYEALLELEKQKVMQEAQIPILSQLSIELDCPEGFDIDQFSWSKLQELRTARIEKEIEGKQLSLEFSKLKQKLERLDAEESVFANCISDMKASRDVALASLRDLESNLEMVVRLRQGQDEVDKDAVVTDYTDALLLPSAVLSKYNVRIKELGKEKISILSKIKLFRRKINLIDWEAKHHGMEARHFEAYLTDLQLFRVTRELQRVIRDGSDAAQAKERLDKVAARIEYQSQDAEVKLLALKKNNEFFKRQLEDRQTECISLEERIGMLKAQVNLSKSVKQSRDDARGGTGGDPVTMAATKMKKVVARRHMVDTARAQAEEIDYLRQELDKMRQRTFPSFVKATRKRLTAVNGDAI